MSTLRPLHCRTVGGLDDNDRATEGISDMTLDEFTHLTSTLAY